ncbi:hypothetical protein [Scytonema sp. NUACC26]|uniref:hypothetical protein n=1 Tax=Scytonema sp. NUACC26 TaxID=3140176 RepID=UPI0034DB95DE
MTIQVHEVFLKNQLSSECRIQLSGERGALSSGKCGTGVLARTLWKTGETPVPQVSSVVRQFLQKKIMEDGRDARTTRAECCTTRAECCTTRAECCTTRAECCTTRAECGSFT